MWLVACLSFPRVAGANSASGRSRPGKGPSPNVPGALRVQGLATACLSSARQLDLTFASTHTIASTLSHKTSSPAPCPTRKTQLTLSMREAMTSSATRATTRLRPPRNASSMTMTSLLTQKETHTLAIATMKMNSHSMKLRTEWSWRFRHTDIESPSPRMVL